MAHYALLDETNTVIQVITGNDESNGVYDWEKLYSKETGYNCKRTSYNTSGGKHNNGGTPYRKNYAGIGYTYDELRDAFIPPKPFASWILDEESCLWGPPVQYPTDGNSHYSWNEDTLEWELL